MKGELRREGRDEGSEWWWWWWGTSSSSSSSSFLLPLKALFAILVSASLKGESTGGGREGGSVCDNEKRRTTSVFARCAFCDPHLALRHGGRNRRKEYTRRKVERQREGGRSKRERGVGRGEKREKKKKKRSRRSFTEIICTQGVCVRAHSSFCGCVPPHIYSAQVHGFHARHYAPVIKRFSTAHQQCLIIALISAQTATAC